MKLMQQMLSCVNLRLGGQELDPTALPEVNDQEMTKTSALG